ncbi:MAG: hypothetical protein E4H01_04685 [Lysobacterales bacterium]|nr:MAG: hypothetical protein E4H01_04685 [Xanthomonadales bacterium]
MRLIAILIKLCHPRALFDQHSVDVLARIKGEIDLTNVDVAVQDELGIGCFVEAPVSEPARGGESGFHSPSRAHRRRSPQIRGRPRTVSGVGSIPWHWISLPFRTASMTANSRFKRPNHVPMDVAGVSLELSKLVVWRCEGG